MINYDGYFNGVCKYITKPEETIFLQENNCKNTGILSEKYIEKILTDNNINYKRKLRIKTEKSYIIPDFYLPEYDIILEIKSRSYTCTGTASEKIDHIPRKYSSLLANVKYMNTKIIVVFCAYETINPICLELVKCESDYSKDFTNICKKYNVINWVNVDKLIEILRVQDKNIEQIKTKPFIKWAGGKTKLSQKILDHFPKEYLEYYEPFVGGGSIGLSLKKDIKKHFSDINLKLIKTYLTVKNDCDKLILELKKQEYSNNKESFLNIRSKFNENSDDITTASMFIYLNKCCFNGLYRENLSGEFNVPFGDMKNPTICDEKLLKKVSKYLDNVEIKHQNYNEISPNSGDLVYFDPPYHQTFSSYSKNGFTEKDHISLKEFIDLLSSKNVKIILSNSNTEFIQKLYENYNQKLLDINYTVGKNRSIKQEILITNF